jgi:zinc transporter ZupT
MGAPVLATVVGLCGAFIGLWMTSAQRRSRVLLPLSAGVLLGVVLFGLLPEIIRESGWAEATILFAVGYLLLLVINRYVYPVCPTCSHDHDHGPCASELHGFAAPLVGVMAVHSFLDGWGVATVQQVAPLGLRVAVPLAIALHKLPEGIAIGAILRAAVKSRTTAMGLCVAAQGATLLGGAAGLWMDPHLGSVWITYPLGIAAGWLGYLGYHAVHEEVKRRGAISASASAGGGVAIAAVLTRGAEAIMR